MPAPRIAVTRDPAIDLAPPRIPDNAMNAAALPVPEWRDALLDEYADLRARLELLMPCIEVPFHLPWIDGINRLKRQGVARVDRHSCDSDVIVLCGVHFMAESAKILAPDRTVLIPDLEAGCSLASSITAADVRMLRARPL